MSAARRSPRPAKAPGTRKATAPGATPIQQLAEQGQSLWLDNIRRQLLTSGELERLRDQGVTGVTSNPTIFEKAVSGSTDYDEAMVRLVRAGRKPDQMLWDLMVEDIANACDVFRPVYDRTDGRDGYVSIEVSPVVARSTKKTIAIAQELHDRVGRPNVMVKIPATRPGLPAITEMIARGVNINVTLIFAVERYEAVVEAYIRGLEELRERGGDPARIGSVASFFVSRVDGKVDRLLQQRIEAATEPALRAELEGLLGKAAIDNSKLAYEQYLRLHSGHRWQSLARAGARTQRCLWASTSTKDPRYPDTMYVEGLIGPDTVDTVPPATLDAFRDHGRVTRTLDAGVADSHRRLARLAEVGVDLEQVTAELETEGVDSFAKSFEELLDALKRAAREIRAGNGPRQWHSLGRLQPEVDAEAARLQKAGVPARLWAKDPTLWSSSRRRAPEIVDRLGWLDVATRMQGERSRLRELTREARTFSDAVLFGMGGSSLAPEVLRATFGRVKGQPDLHVLDTTDPATVTALHRRIDVTRTLFLVASKSGTTTETLSHLAYFWEEVTRAGVRRPGRQFAAITDPGTPLEALASDRGFRWTFANPPDIGGRYSALSFFGLVPGAVAGVDVEGLLGRAGEMARACAADVEVDRNPGAWMGAAFGRLAAGGRDKLTLLVTPRLRAFGPWVEQLIAESTGKEGKGIVPIEGEPVGPPDVYGEDRLFVHVRLDSDREVAAVRALEAAGLPVITLTLRDRLDLGGEFLRWEIATAVAGSVLGIDAFDQPNVQESKDNTKKVLGEFERAGRLPEVPAVPVAEAGLAVAGLVRAAPAHGYFGIMAYTGAGSGAEPAIDAIRARVRAATGLATTAGFGPRFLHSTGQLHKGGPPEGVFLQVVQEDRRDAAIPGEHYGFSVLKQAQAIGDYRALEAHGRPVVRVSLGERPGRAWKDLAAAIEAALQ